MDKGEAVVVSPHHHRHTRPTTCHHGHGQSVLKGIVDQRPLSKPKNALSLMELIEAVENELQQPREPGYSLEKHIVLRELLEQYSGDWRELERFAFADRTQLYTRNLVATDHETYALILIVWNPGKYSPIHDHPCDGCWVKVITGCANEVRYQIQDHKLVEVDNATFAHGVTYMHDDFGLHKMGNPSSSTDAVTLHLYSPPYPKCQIWFDEGDATKSSEARPCYFSEYGERVVK